MNENEEKTLLVKAKDLYCSKYDLTRIKMLRHKLIEILINSSISNDVCEKISEGINKAIEEIKISNTPTVDVICLTCHSCHRISPAEFAHTDGSRHVKCRTCKPKVGFNISK